MPRPMRCSDKVSLVHVGLLAFYCRRGASSFNYDLLTYLLWDKSSFVTVVRRDRAVTKQIKIGAKELDEAVTALREGLDPGNILPC